MTEQEWLTSEDPTRMLRHVWRGASNRKVRLFACARCRLNWHRLGDERSRRAVEVAERYADRLVHEDERKAVRDAAQLVVEEAVAVRHFETAAYARDAMLTLDVATDRLVDRERSQQQADLVRDIFGDPFHPLPPRPTEIAPLAEEIYAGAWDKMPLLGEWLQEHGYWDIGEHCLHPETHHVKGCYVIDWITGNDEIKGPTCQGSQGPEANLA